MTNLRRAYIQITRDIIPGVLNKVREAKPQPRGRQRLASEEWAISVPLQYETKEQSERVAVICHLFHAELVTQLASGLASTGLKADLFLSTDTEEKAARIRDVFQIWSCGVVTIRVVENRGRDIAPKLIAFPDVYDKYDLLLFIHSKKSDHSSFGDRWREYLLSCLVGSGGVVRSILELFRLCPEVGMIIPPHFEELRSTWPMDWGTSFRRARRLGWKMDFDVGENGLIDFPSGSMFWARPAATKPLLKLKLKMSDFPPEPVLGEDGTLAHHIERLFLFVCERSGYKWLKVINERSASPSQQRVVITKPTEIRDFIAVRGIELLGDQPDN